MRKGLDILLINSFAPRHRIVSDTSLENSLALISTHLQEQGFAVHVVDEQRVTSVEKGVPRWVLHLLRLLSHYQVEANNASHRLVSLLLLLISWPLQALSLYYRRQYMNRLMDNIVSLVNDDGIPMVGIKLWYGDAYKWSLALAEKIKTQCPDTVVIAGGPHVKVFGEHVLEEQVFDLAIMGPGEEALAQLLSLRKETSGKQTFLDLLQSAFGPSRLIRTGQFNLSDHPTVNFGPIPQYTSVDLKDKMLFHTLVDGIGCSWNKCSFCSHTRQCVSYMPRPVEQIRREILETTRQGIGFFRFSSSETPADHGRAIANMLLEQGININYSMFVRAGKVTPEIYDSFRLMIRSGLRAVFMGGETGHDLINKSIMNKGVTRREIAETIQSIKLAAADTGIPCRVGLSMIYPCPVLPGITLDDVFQANMNLIKETMPDAVIINPPGLFPGTFWFDHAENLGFKIGQTFVTDMMEYEYSNYKPIELWPPLGYSLNGQSLANMLKETGKLRRAVEDLGIPMGVSDELLMMLDAIGLQSKADRMHFRKHSLIDIMSGTSYYIGSITKRINEQSKRIAYTNHPHLTK